MTAPKQINLGLNQGSSLMEQAKAEMGNWGKTDLYSTSDPVIDEYLGGGYGRKDGYEIITIFGGTGCIFGDAEIPFKSKYVKNTKKIKLENLYKRFHGLPYRGSHGPHDDETIYVRTNSGDDLPTWTEVEDVLDKGVRKVLRMCAGGREIVATPDHKFLTVDGWKPLDELSVGDKIIMASSETKKRQGKKPIISHVVYTKYHPTNRTTLVDGRYRYHIGLEHRLAYEAKMNGMTYDEYVNLLNHYDGRKLLTIPDGMEIHHIDGEHTNNSQDNLEMLTKSEHAKMGIITSIANFDYSNIEVEIESIEEWTNAHVYDVVCKGSHCFVANGFIVHNCNKSTMTTSFILNAASKGTKVAYFALEDDPKDVVKRIYIQCGMDEDKVRTITSNILFAPENDGYTLDAMAEAIEKIFKMVDIVVVDPLQFIFEASVTERGETEFNRQRLFMRKMNNIMKHTNKTLIIVSHTNKGNAGKDSKVGMDKIIGSSAVAQVSTKVIEIDRKDGIHGIRLWKTRFTPYRFTGIQIHLDDMNIRTHYTSDDLNQLRNQW